MRLRPPRSPLFPYTTLFRSSIRGWQAIDKSDMNIKPDAATAFIDPFREQPTISFFGDIYDPRTGQRDRKSTRLNSSHLGISYAVFCLKKKTKKRGEKTQRHR